MYTFKNTPEKRLNRVRMRSRDILGSCEQTPWIACMALKSGSKPAFTWVNKCFLEPICTCFLIVNKCFLEPICTCFLIVNKCFLGPEKNKKGTKREHRTEREQKVNKPWTGNKPWTNHEQRFLLTLPLESCWFVLGDSRTGWFCENRSQKVESTAGLNVWHFYHTWQGFCDSVSNALLTILITPIRIIIALDYTYASDSYHSITWLY